MRVSFRLKALLVALGCYRHPPEPPKSHRSSRAESATMETIRRFAEEFVETGQLGG